MNGTIYKILALNSKKLYIGSAKNIKDRIRCHLKDLRDNKHHSVYLQRVFNKYGLRAQRYYRRKEFFDKLYNIQYIK